jgi:hypothetical protein
MAPCSNAPIYSKASRRPTKEGFTVPRDAAEFYEKAGNHMQISLIGHTDAAEGDDEELSMRRAELSMAP